MWRGAWNTLVLIIILENVMKCDRCEYDNEQLVACPVCGLPFCGPDSDRWCWGWHLEMEHEDFSAHIQCDNYEGDDVEEEAELRFNELVKNLKILKD